MAETKIEWTRRPRADGSGVLTAGYTFNGHRGCARKSEGCRFCFAEALSKRNPAVLGRWGANGTRTVAAESYWRLPVKWDKQAREMGERRIVFSADLGDVFEDWQGPMLDANDMRMWRAGTGQWMPSSPVKFGGEPTGETDRRPNPGCEPLTMDDVRIRLLGLIADTPHLDWLLLTKRPENVLRMLADICRIEADRYLDSHAFRLASAWFHGEPPANVWLGASVENQEMADERVPLLIAIPAKVRFLSLEPLLGPVNLSEWLWPYGRTGDSHVHDSLTDLPGEGLHWGVIGGESGPGARPFDLQWGRDLIGQFKAAGVPVFMKQVGSNSCWHDDERKLVSNKLVPVMAFSEGWQTVPMPRDKKGGDPAEWPEELRVRQFPAPPEASRP